MGPSGGPQLRRSSRSWGVTARKPNRAGGSTCPTPPMGARHLPPEAIPPPQCQSPPQEPSPPPRSVTTPWVPIYLLQGVCHPPMGATTSHGCPCTPLCPKHSPPTPVLVFPLPEVSSLLRGYPCPQGCVSPSLSPCPSHYVCPLGCFSPPWVPPPMGPSPPVGAPPPPGSDAATVRSGVDNAQTTPERGG